MPEITAASIVALYRQSEADTQAWLRETYPRLKLEFDAIDRIADQRARIAAKEAQYGAR